jgi:DNA-binding HxlR family transcriptional regulator
MCAFPVSPSQDDVLLVVRPGKWTLTIIDQLRDGTLRFNELKRQAAGISQKTLSLTLRELERDGFVTRTLFASIPPRVDYTLTEVGRDLLDFVDSWRAFALRNGAKVVEARRLYDSLDHGHGLV